MKVQNRASQTNPRQPLQTICEAIKKNTADKEPVKEKLGAALKRAGYREGGISREWFSKGVSSESVEREV